MRTSQPHDDTKQLRIENDLATLSPFYIRRRERGRGACVRLVLGKPTHRCGLHPTCHELSIARDEKNCRYADVAECFLYGGASPFSRHSSYLHSHGAACPKACEGGPGEHGAPIRKFDAARVNVLQSLGRVRPGDRDTSAVVRETRVVVLGSRYDDMAT